MMAHDAAGRAGRYERQPGGYRAFVPRPLPPEPRVKLDGELSLLLSEADIELGRLDAATEFLPNPDLFLAMYVRKEALLSSQIEGTRASLPDVLRYELDRASDGEDAELEEVSNYVSAMNLGIERLRSHPLGLDLIREMHAVLLRGTRGSKRRPGELRTVQNYIAAPGAGIEDADFVPPPPRSVPAAMRDLGSFLRGKDRMPLLVRCALAHCQFETIHPFLDGNGRMGRLLITFILCWKGALHRPMLHISTYLKRHRSRYYERLQAVRDEGDFEGWLSFFLTGVAEVSAEATETARRISVMQEAHRALVLERMPNPASAQVLLDALLQQPFTTVGAASRIIKRTFPVANGLIGELEALGLLEERTGRARGRVYAYAPYLSLFGELAP